MKSTHNGTAHQFPVTAAVFILLSMCFDFILTLRHVHLLVSIFIDFTNFCHFSHLICMFMHYSESNSLSPPFFTGSNGTAQKGRPRKRKLMMNHHQNDPLSLGTAMQMGMFSINFISIHNFSLRKSKISHHIFFHSTVDCSVLIFQVAFSTLNNNQK